jgi:hypothetical protein
MPLPHYSLFPFFHRYQTTYLRRDPLLFEEKLPQRTISCFFHEFIPVCRQLYFLDSNTAAPSQCLHLVSARVSAYDELNRIQGRRRFDLFPTWKSGVPRRQLSFFVSLIAQGFFKLGFEGIVYRAE